MLFLYEDTAGAADSQICSLVSRNGGPKEITAGKGRVALSKAP